ncbi:MAG: L-aspartate oxidase [Leptospiraceae bacterium]|nr:L-aspartate oxidase [Leptospiraceae bacterium]
MKQGFDTDFLVLGSGVAGLYLALQLAELGSVTVITKARPDDANTSWAQGGVASVLSANDSFESHIADTLEAGAGLCDPQAVRVLVTEGPGHVRKLMELGARFAQDEAGHLELGREGGHSQNRIVHADDLTGLEIERVLLQAVQERGIRLLDQHVVVELITRYHVQDELPKDVAECYGAYVYDRETWEIFIIRARSTILATGGAGQVYLHNTNPEVATGDGVALAYRAGARIANMEFYQFHPTALYNPDSKVPFLISEALRGFGGRLLDDTEQEFMARYDERRELAPRDIVARAIDSELKRRAVDHVWLDVRHKDREELMSHFPNIFAHCLDLGIDISKDLIPVVPAAHYMCGGVQTDLSGATNSKRLFAIGEVACSGVHGGNRLASNSLLEGLVFANRVAEYLRSEPPPAISALPRAREWNKDGLTNAEEWILVRHNYEEIKKIMWDYVGIVRSNLRLLRARSRIQLLNREIQDFYKRTRIQNKILELRNLGLVARLILESALMRTESRGLHFSTDYPENRNPSREDSILRRDPGHNLQEE